MARPFAPVPFDCTAGASFTAPSCTADVSDNAGDTIPATCSVGVGS
jgi:hypothetical protein